MKVRLSGNEQKMKYNLDYSVRLPWEQEVVGSNPTAQTSLR